MTKLQFLFALRDRLAGLPQNDLEERLRFYSEMIEDRMEEGLSEEDAVAAVGSVEEIAAQITADIPAPKQPAAKRQFKAWEIVLLVLGSPIWLSLLIAVGAVVLSLYVSVWAVFASVAACAFGGVVGGAILMLGKYPAQGLALISAGIVCAGLSILFFFGCKGITKGLVLLTKVIFKRRAAK